MSRTMSKPVAETMVATATAGSGADLQETPLQCILYYSNPNFINDQDSATIQFGNDEDEEEEDEEDDDDEEDEDEEEEEDFDDSNIKTQGFDQHPHQPRHHHPHRQHQPHQQQQQQTSGLQGIDDHASLEDQELDADFFYEQDTTTSESRTTSMVESSIRSRQRQFSQQRLVGGPGGGGGLRGPGPSLACICRATIACLRTKPCLFFIYVLVVLVLLSSFVSIVLVAVLVVEPFARVSGFLNGTCRTLEVSVGREEQSCSCGKGCNSKYFCLKIQVEYFDVQAYAILTGTLYEDETSLNRQCSFYPPCRSSRQENEEAVHIYERLYGRPGLEFGCWYNPDNNNSSSYHARRTSSAFSRTSGGGGGEVIQSKRFQAHHVAHGLVWSTLLFFGSFSFLFYMFRRKGCFH